MSSTSAILTRIETYCSVAGIAETTFGKRTVNDGKFVGRLRSGGSMTLRTLDRIEAFLSSPSARNVPPTHPDVSESCSEPSVISPENAEGDS